MLLLLGTTLTTSFFDCLNPSAIAQQMLLQAMVKNKRHIWFFILGIGLANLVMGLAIYYGVAAWVSRLLAALTAAYPLPVYGVELGAGAVCAALGVWLMIGTIRKGSHEEDGGGRIAEIPWGTETLVAVCDGSHFLLGGVDQRFALFRVFGRAGRL